MPFRADRTACGMPCPQDGSPASPLPPHPFPDGCTVPIARRERLAAGLRFPAAPAAGVPADASGGAASPDQTVSASSWAMLTASAAAGDGTSVPRDARAAGRPCRGTPVRSAFRTGATDVADEENPGIRAVRPANGTALPSSPLRHESGRGEPFPEHRGPHPEAASGKTRRSGSRSGTNIPPDPRPPRHINIVSGDK